MQPPPFYSDIKEPRLQNPVWRATADLPLLWYFVRQWQRKCASSSFVSLARCVNLLIVHNFEDSWLVFLPFLIYYICCFTVKKAIP